MSASFTIEQALASLAKQPVRHLVNGRLADSEQYFDVINPSTGMTFAQCPEASQAQLDEAVVAARRAQPEWSMLAFAQRRERLHGLAGVLRTHQAELAALITLEQGKPLPKATDEVMRAASQIERVASIPLEHEVLRDDAQGRIELHYRPLGVVGAITPWNMPIVLAIPKITHALYTGNTVVLKPSPYTPLATLRLGELARDLFPAGVLNILAGGNDFGRWMSEHPDIDKISFTGSIPTGKRVMMSSAVNLKRLTLELGGNDAAIVLDDVDPAVVAPKIFAAAFVNSGQVCMAIKRLYVQDGVYDRLADALAQLAKTTRVGDGFEPGVELGPVQNRAQYEIVKGILEDTQQRGARVLAGGHALNRPGYFIEPTIVADIAEGSRLVDEEPFGPVLPIIRFSDVDDAIRRANDSSFGLSGSVWSTDINHASAIAARLEVGTAWINHHVGADAFVPFGGSKQSGIGREYGEAGLRHYMEATAVFIPHAPSIG
jgi:acyl-CoA reductase-like NAD-dependent aldehyde dehydrogenase